ncbi:MAG: elongation factor EF-2, partial [Candidatus Woesearchaeota archaeon]
NICTSAHIHHGKTAFTDNLLAAAGMMKADNAGDLDAGMQTWQHADEQERLMTVDSANVSMVHEYQGHNYLINLIDTPGHVDFGGNVTRAMRAIDGTVVLVCASEGFMPQTETVMKQAIRERVKPILFINKVDRLIIEMQYTPEKVQQRFVEILNKFNELIEKLAEPEYKQKWKASIQEGSFAFGSAKDNWALSFSFMQKKGIKFSDIQKIYELEGEERRKWVWENAPLHEVILDMAIKNLPNPIEAQQYRIPKIWHGDKESELGKDLITANPNGKLAFVVTRVMIDPKSGKEIAAGRLFSGTIKQGQEVYLNNDKTKARIQIVYIYNGIKPELIDALPAGNVLAITGVNAAAGETITMEPAQPFEELKHIFDPVITKSVEPLTPADLPKVVEVLRKSAKEDPSIKIEINEETGECLMSGMGELHLEIIEGRIINEKGVKIKTSPPIVVFRETVTKQGQEAEGKSPNKHNKFYFVVEPIEPAVAEAIKEGQIHEGRVKKGDLDMRKAFQDCGYDTKEAESVRDIYNGSIYLDKTKGQIHMIEVEGLILDMFEEVMRQGPLAREPCINLKISLMDMSLHEDAIHRGPSQVYPAVREGIKASMNTAGPVVFEPVQIMLIDGPEESVGSVTKIVSGKRGQMLDMEVNEQGAVVKAKIPVMELIGWASDLRSATEGKGVSSLIDQNFEKLPNEKQDEVITQIRNRKGLSENQ